MTVQPSSYEIVRAIEDQLAVVEASQKATAKLVDMLKGMLDASAPEPLLNFSPASLRRAHKTAGSAAQLSGNAAEPSPVVQPAEKCHVDRNASAWPPSAESEAAIPSKPGDAGTGQGSEAEIRNAVVPPGENAGSAVRVGAQVSDVPATAEARPPAEPDALQSPMDLDLKPGQLAVVDVSRCRVIGPLGDVFVNVRAARALDVLKAGHLLGLDHIATQAKLPTPADCRHALRVEEAALKTIGLSLYLEKFNARLREAC